MGRGRITIGLYNSYDQNFREPHRRVIARAGDLARAYDMGLALFGFPIPEDARTPKEIAEWVAGTTSIGGHGKNFMEMAETGRFQCFPYPGKGFPPQLGNRPPRGPEGRRIDPEVQPGHHPRLLLPRDGDGPWCCVRGVRRQDGLNPVTPASPVLCRGSSPCVPSAS